MIVKDLAGLAEFSSQKMAKTTVARGQTIAFTGSTGHSTGPHLHHELRQWGVAVDPYPLCTYGGQLPGSIGDEMTDEQLATLGQWMQEQTGVILDVLVGSGWRGNSGLLAAWHWDTRNVINAHTDAAVGAGPASAAVEAVESATPTTELTAVGTDDDDQRD